MCKFLSLASLAFFFTTATAWLPGTDKIITAQDGTDLFNFTESTNTTDKRWLNQSGKLRGVNLGSLFVIEPWLNRAAFDAMGCQGVESEFDCVIKLGQERANQVFKEHWNSWITLGDIRQMQSYHLNTIRIPVGYWMLESLVYADSEHFPQGAFSYLERLCGWASDAGFYIIIDMHGAPGAQVAKNAFTGQLAPSPGFYESWQFDRGVRFLSWLTTQIHTRPAFRNVGMVGIVNEPVQNSDTAFTMRSQFYPNAFKAIRDVEAGLGVSSGAGVHIQPMNNAWGSGNPNQFVPDLTNAAYDDHRYLKWDSSVPVSQSSYVSTSCSDNRGGNPNTVVGEFSLSVPDNVQWTDGWHPNSQKDFYKRWFAAQIMSYERNTLGWVFWTWKSQLGDYRWSYQDAVGAGVIPTQPQDVYGYGVC